MQLSFGLFFYSAALVGDCGGGWVAGEVIVVYTFFPGTMKYEWDECGGNCHVSCGVFGGGAYQSRLHKSFIIFSPSHSHNREPSRSSLLLFSTFFSSLLLYYPLLLIMIVLISGVGQ